MSVHEPKPDVPADFAPPEDTAAPVEDATPGLSANAERRVQSALRAADDGQAYHWPTIAATLAVEVRRLRGAARESAAAPTEALAAACGPDATPAPEVAATQAEGSERYDQGSAPPPADVIGVCEVDGDPDPDLGSLQWGRVIGQDDEWKGYKSGRVYLSWDELTRRWGPLVASAWRVSNRADRIEADA